MKCKYCESENVVQNLRPDTIHYAELRCKDCGVFQVWLKKPKDLPQLIEDCEFHLRRTGYEWQSNRVLDFCERVCGHRSHKFLQVSHLRILAKKLKELPTIKSERT